MHPDSFESSIKQHRAGLFQSWLLPLKPVKIGSDTQSSYRDRQGVFGRFIVQDGGDILWHRPPARVYLPAMKRIAAGACCPAFAFAFALVVSSVLRQTEVLLSDTASFLKLNVDGVRGLMGHSHVVPNSVSPKLRAEGQKKAAQLPLESLVEVEVDERVVDVGAFGKQRGENKALRSHVPVLLVENVEEGHNSIGGPGNHKTQADAEKHL